MTTGLGTIREQRGRDVRDRVRLCFNQVHKSLRNPLTRTLATQMVLNAGCPSQQLVNVPKIEIDKCQIGAVYWHVKQHAYYMGDTANLDTYQSLKRSFELSMPAVLARAIPQFREQAAAWLREDTTAKYMDARIIGDCDDIGTIVMDSLLASIGFRVGAKCIGTDERHYMHIYGVVEIPRFAEGDRQIVTLDTTEFDAYPGWEPPARYRRAERIFWYEE